MTPVPSTLLVVVGLAFAPSSLALQLSAPLAVQNMRNTPRVAQSIATPRAAQTRVMMRDDSDSGGFAKILSVSVAASAKLAKERPVFFTFRIAILGSGIYFFATLAGALLQRAL